MQTQVTASNDGCLALPPTHRQVCLLQRRGGTAARQIDGHGGTPCVQPVRDTVGEHSFGASKNYSEIKCAYAASDILQSPNVMVLYV